MLLFEEVLGQLLVWACHFVIKHLVGLVRSEGILIVVIVYVIINLTVDALNDVFLQIIRLVVERVLAHSHVFYLNVRDISRTLKIFSCSLESVASLLNLHVVEDVAW